MNFSDRDTELLDRYLDNDLTDAEAIGLEARLQTDDGMSAELARMREYRSLRAEAFASLEATETESQQLQWYVRGALHQQSRALSQTTTPAAGISLFGRVSQWAGGLSRVAAVLAVGLIAGYGLRGTTINGVSPVSQSQPVALNPGMLDQPTGFIPERTLAAGMAGVMPVGGQVVPAGYDVALSDQFGNVVTTRRFSTLQEAREFTNDVAKWQQRHRQVQTNGVRLIGDDF